MVETGSCDRPEDILEVLAMPWVHLGCGVQFLSFQWLAENSGLQVFWLRDLKLKLLFGILPALRPRMAILPVLACVCVPGGDQILLAFFFVVVVVIDLSTHPK